MNRIVDAHRRDRRRRVHQPTPATTTSTCASAPSPNANREAALRAPAGDAGQGAALHRALPGPRRQGRAGAEPGEEAREDRDGRAAAPAARSSSSTSAPPPRSGEDVVALRGHPQGATASASIYDGFDFNIRRTERWCVMGRNGAGKTTLLRLVAGALAARRRHGATRRLAASWATSRSSRWTCSTRRSPCSSRCRTDFPQAETRACCKNLLGAFQFSGIDVDKPIRVLSGGEKSRLVLARMLFDPPNFLVLDEPTNHLDLETKEMLV